MGGRGKSKGSHLRPWWPVVLLLWISYNATAFVVKDSIGKPVTFSGNEGERGKATHLFAVSRRDWLKYTAALATASTGLQRSNAEEAVVSIVPRSGMRLPADSAMCDPTVSTWTKGDRVVHIVGTAHISSDSAVLAGNLVREVHPQAVFVELDAKRIGRAMPAKPSTLTLTEPTTASIPPTPDKSLPITLGIPPAPSADFANPNFNPFDVRERMLRAGSALVGDAIKKLYENLQNQGFSAGEEFAIAIREGLNMDAVIILGDQDVNYTLRRITQALGKTDVAKLFAPDSPFERSIERTLPEDLRRQIQTMDKEKGLDAQQLSLFIETMKTKDTVKKLMDNLKEVAPELYNALVAERDLFMARGLDSLNQFESIVAVMGLAHLDGVERNLRSFGWTPVNFRC